MGLDELKGNTMGGLKIVHEQQERTEVSMIKLTSQEEKEFFESGSTILRNKTYSLPEELRTGNFITVQNEGRFYKAEICGVNQKADTLADIFVAYRGISDRDRSTS